MTVLRVGAMTRTSALAGAIAGVMREKGEVDLHCVGPQAIGVGVKATAVARGFLMPNGIDAYAVPVFLDFEDRNDGSPKTAINLMVRAFGD